MFQSKSESNRIINDPVPKNASKFPIHQTYLTSDAERTGTGGYKFKAPEVWSSARSGKKSIAIRSIHHIQTTFDIRFDLHIQIQNTIEHVFTFEMVTPPDYSLIYLIAEITRQFDAWVEENEFTYKLTMAYDKSHSLSIYVENTSTNTTPCIYLSEPGYPDPPEELNRFLNQPEQYLITRQFDTSILIFEHVWDKEGPLYFHASFIPFDNYQFLGELNDEWNNPIIYQDPNTSPLFNIWITSDLKTPFPILHEHFIFRFTFIISSSDFYD